MKASATQGKTRRATNLATGKGKGPTPGLIVAAVLHAGVLAWALGNSNTSPPAIRLPFGPAIAATATLALLVIFLIAAFGRRSGLSFVVVPAMIVAGVATHAVSAARLTSPDEPHLLAGVLAFGALGVAVNLSFGAAAIAARIAPAWGRLELGQSAAFRLGALGLVAVVAVAAISEQLAPLAALAASVGVIVLGTALRAVEDDTKRGPAMAELVSGIALSLGAVWTASIVAGASQAATTPAEWTLAQTAMRFAWIMAIPLVLAALVGLGPRVTLTGAGVKRGRSTVLATAIGAITCMGLSHVVLRESAEALAVDPSTRSGSASGGKPSAKTSAEAKRQNEAQSGPAASASSVATRPMASTEGDEVMVAPSESPAERELLHHESERTMLDISIKIDGPMLPRDARQGVEKSFKRLVECYEASKDHGQPSELRLGLLVDNVGSVKQAEPIDAKQTDKKYVTCVQLALYRSGFSGPAKLTWLELQVRFLPRD